MNFNDPDRKTSWITTIGQLYRRYLRFLVIAIALLTGIGTLIWAICLFSDIYVDNSENVPRLAMFAAVMGFMYVLVTVFEFFGVLAAAVAKPSLVRLYTVLSVACLLLLISASLMHLLVHYMEKAYLIQECSSLAQGLNGVVATLGTWLPIVETHLPPMFALEYCNIVWSRTSTAEIVGLVLVSVVAFLNCIPAFGYNRQLSRKESSVLGNTRDYNVNTRPSSPRPLPTAVRTPIPTIRPPRNHYPGLVDSQMTLAPPATSFVPTYARSRFESNTTRVGSGQPYTSRIGNTPYTGPNNFQSDNNRVPFPNFNGTRM